MTHSYTVCEHRYDHQYDGMPRDDSGMSGRIGCTGGTRNGHFFQHDPLEEELDPCLSAAVRYQKEKRSSGLLRLKYFLCCVIVLLAITLLAVALLIIFGASSAPVESKNRISTVNANDWASGQTVATIDEEVRPTKQTEEAPHIQTGQHGRMTVPIPIPRPSSLPNIATPKPPRTAIQPPAAPPPIIIKPKLTTTTLPPIPTTTTTKNTPTTVAPPLPRGGTRRVHDCEDHFKLGRQSGAHKLTVDNYEFYAYCEMESGHGWNVLQKRTGDKYPFWNATFSEYADGFGNIPDGDYWLGLESLWAIGDFGKMEMRIRIQGDLCESKACSGLGEKGVWWGDWEFSIDDRSNGYRISNLKYLHGNLSDPTALDRDMFHYLCNNGRFTTVDMDNDENVQGNCAEIRDRGAWWHRDCAYTALNGRYGVKSSKPNGFFWLWKSSEGEGAGTRKTYVIKPKQSLILFRRVAQ